MLKRFALFVVAATMVMILVAACGGSKSDGGTSSSGSAGTSTPVTMVDTKFSVTTLSGKVGEKMTVKLDNKGAVAHDFTIDSIGGARVHVAVDPGKSGTATFTPDKAGDFKFYCSVPGHDAAGMHGTLTVS